MRNTIKWFSLILGNIVLIFVALCFAAFDYSSFKILTFPIIIAVISISLVLFTSFKRLHLWISRIYQLIVIVFVLLFFLWILNSKGIPPPFKNERGEIVSNSISKWEIFNLNGIEQWAVIRGKNKDKPMLIYLSGGLGFPDFPTIRKYFPKIEEEFLVVHWEQRVVGKSCCPDFNENNFTLQHYIDDIGELSKQLIQRYNRDKIYIVGHSWGTIIGLLAVKEYPDLFYAYVGIGLNVCPAEEANYIYPYLLDKANQTNNENLKSILKEIGQPPYQNPLEHRKLFGYWTSYYSGSKFSQKWRSISTTNILLCPDYNIIDKFKWRYGFTIPNRYVFDDWSRVDLKKMVKKIEIPFYVIEGINDYNTPYPAAKNYFDSLVAPQKKFYTILNSGHDCQFDNPSRFYEIMDEILKETYENQNVLLLTSCHTP